MNESWSFSMIYKASFETAMHMEQQANDEFKSNITTRSKDIFGNGENKTLKW